MPTGGRQSAEELQVSPAALRGNRAGHLYLSTWKRREIGKQARFSGGLHSPNTNRSISACAQAGTAQSRRHQCKPRCQSRQKDGTVTARLCRHHVLPAPPLALHLVAPWRGVQPGTEPGSCPEHSILLFSSTGSFKRIN